MYYVIYKTVNKINGNFYIGYHKTSDINDDYLGSGTRLRNAIKKYGLENFQKEILYVFPTMEEAIIKEMEIVDEEFIKNPKTYNLRIGGDGGWSYINEVLNSDLSYRNKFKKKVQEGVRRAIDEGKMDESFRKNGIRFAKMNKEKLQFLGKNHSDISKQKISENNGSRLSKAEIRKRILELKEVQFGWGWKSEIAKRWGIPHQHVKSFLDRNLIGARIRTLDHIYWDGVSSDIEFTGVVKSYSLSEDTGNLLMLNVEGDFNLGSKIIGIKEDILDFID